MRVLFLGGSGQIGFPAACRFANRFPQAEVVATSRSGLAPAPLPANLQFVAFDPFKDSWDQLGRFSLLFNCIGQIRASAAMSFEQIHEGLTRIILEKRSLLGEPRLVQLSALGAGEHPRIPFLETKAQADRLLLQAADTYVVRPSIVCTEETMLLRKLRQLGRTARWLGGILPLPAGFLQARVQPIMVDDLATILCKVGEEGGSQRIIPAVGPEALSFGQLLQWVNGRPLRVVEIPRRWLEPLVRYLIAPLFPSLINYDQFRLLFADNVADTRLTGEKLEGKTASTVSFWKTA